MGVQKTWLLFTDEGDDFQESKGILYRSDIAMQMGKGIMRDVKSLGKFYWLFLGLLRRSGGHDDINTFFLKATDQFEEDPGRPALIKSRYEL
jgi:hypothetical protein